MGSEMCIRDSNRIQDVNEDYLTNHGSIVIDRLALAIARLAILLEVELSG